MKKFFKRIKLYHILLVIYILAIIAFIALNIIFDLLGNTWTILGVIIGVSSSLGILAYFEIDDWLIWYKRWSVKKYQTTSGTLNIKVYDDYLKKEYLEVPIFIITYEADIVNRNILLIGTIEADDTKCYIYCTINPITTTVTIKRTVIDTNEYTQYDKICRAINKDKYIISDLLEILQLKYSKAYKTVNLNRITYNRY